MTTTPTVRHWKIEIRLKSRTLRENDCFPFERGVVDVRLYTLTLTHTHTHTHSHTHTFTHTCTHNREVRRIPCDFANDFHPPIATHAIRFWDEFHSIALMRHSTVVRVAMAGRRLRIYDNVSTLTAPHGIIC